LFFVHSKGHFLCFEDITFVGVSFDRDLFILRGSGFCDVDAESLKKVFDFEVVVGKCEQSYRCWMAVVIKAIEDDLFFRFVKKPYEI